MDRITAAEVFIDVARSGSFTATSNRLNMSRPMVTRYVEAMENWFGVRLFHRTTRKVTLTTQGEQSLKAVEPWLETALQLAANAKRSNQLSLSGSVRLACCVSFGHAQLIPAINAFMQLHPEVAINIELQDATTDLIKERIDLAIRIASNPDPTLIGKPIAICRSVLVASKAYLKNMPALLEPEDLSLHHCLNYTNFENQVWHLKRKTEHKSIQVNSRLSANETTVLLEATIGGAGVSMQPTYMANQAINQGRLVSVLSEWKPEDMHIYALYSSRKFLPPAVRALIDFLQQYFKQYPWD